MSRPKRLAAIQPYFFPYIGYFQLIAACDELVLLDDVQYVTRRWINRNRILVNGAPSWITLPVRGAHRGLAINERRYALETGATGRLLDRLAAAYRRAPHSSAVMTLLGDALAGVEDNVALVNARTLHRVTDAIGLARPIVPASGTGSAPRPPGQEGIIELCRRRGATSYLNPIGGRGLYDPARFAAAGLALELLQFETPPYSQFGGPFVPGLSILDVLMFNPPEVVKAMAGRGSI